MSVKRLPKIKGADWVKSTRPPVDLEVLDRIASDKAEMLEVVGGVGAVVYCSEVEGV